MERPKATVEPARDEFDHELTPVQADFISMTDALLEHRDDSSKLTFVDMIVEYDAAEVLEKLKKTGFATLIASPEEQLAIESDGSYYPVLDLRKSKGQLAGVGIRAWGWDEEKIRYTDTDNETVRYPRQYKQYAGEIDKIRELDISFGYDIDGKHVVESIKLYGSTSRSDHVTASRELNCMVYAETGYEGHGRKSMSTLTDNDIYDFLDLIAEIAGETPKSRSEKILEDLAVFRAKWSDKGYGVLVDALIEQSWPAQALYELTGRIREDLRGATIQDVLESGQDELDEVVKEDLQNAIDNYASRRVQRNKKR